MHARVMSRLRDDSAAGEGDCDSDAAAPPVSRGHLGMASDAFAEAMQPLLSLTMKYGVSCDIRFYKEDVTLVSVQMQ